MSAVLGLGNVNHAAALPGGATRNLVACDQKTGKIPGLKRPQGRILMAAKFAIGTGFFTVKGPKSAQTKGCRFERLPSNRNQVV